MSDYRSPTDINQQIAKLLEHAAPDSNDMRHNQYVDYINGFLGYFGGERVYLVGSTAEQTKIRTCIDNSDADFLFVSGRLTIPVKEIEYKAEMSNFVWIRGERLDKAKKLDIDMIQLNDGKQYLSAEILKIVDPKLFTIVRGIYKCVNSTTDSIPGRESRVTTIGERSSVGLARTEFRGLEIIDTDKIPKLKGYFPKKLPPRVHSKKKHKSGDDGEKMKTILELIAAFKTSDDSLSYEGQFSHFINVVKLLLSRQKEETLTRRGDEPLVSFKDSDNEPEDLTTRKQKDKDDDKLKRYGNDLDLPTDVRATYEGKTMKDFVPALKIDGRLPCMEKWFNENGKWLPATIKEAIYNTEMYVVAKNSPQEPDKRDFCLAFNHAEIMLAKALTQTQRKCLLMMKAIYKGVFAKIMKSFDTARKLKTFHVKTTLYWVLEETAGREIWKEENLLGAVRRVLFYLREALEKKHLCHYFTGSNLFVGLEKRLCSALIDGIDGVVADPRIGLAEFFAIEMEGNPEIVLTDEQVRHLIDMSRDGGVENEVNTLEEAVEDFERGFAESRRENGHVPLNEAMNHVMNMYLQIEGERKAKEKLEKLNIPTPENLSGIVSGLLGTITGASAYTVPTSAQTQGGNSSNQEALFTGLADQLLKGSQQQGNAPTRIQVPERSQSDQTQQSPDHGRQLADAVNAFFASSARGEQRRSLENEVKKWGLSHFLGKPE